MTPVFKPAWMGKFRRESELDRLRRENQDLRIEVTRLRGELDQLRYDESWRQSADWAQRSGGVL